MRNVLVCTCLMFWCGVLRFQSCELLTKMAKHCWIFFTILNLLSFILFASKPVCLNLFWVMPLINAPKDFDAPRIKNN